MEVSKNDVNQDVYGLIASIKQHINYRDQDEEKIKRQLKQLYADGNQKAKERADNFYANHNVKKRKRNNQQDADESPILDV